VYATAPSWGRIVDHKGPRILLLIGFFGLLIGYSGIRWIYDTGLTETKDENGQTALGSLSTSHFYALIVCGFFTGAGGNGGLVSAINPTAKSFPDSAVRSAIGCWPVLY
jgi:MFS family permease